MKFAKKSAFIAAMSLAVIASAQAGNMSGGKEMSMGMEGMKDMPMNMKATGEDKAGATHKATGVVKSLNKEKGTVTFAHEAVESLKWPAMTMSFAVKDEAFFNKLVAGEAVKFSFKKEGKSYVVTSVEK
jgi:Cu(I)/Ag(I) efflux system protein CusF